MRSRFSFKQKHNVHFMPPRNRIQWRIYFISTTFVQKNSFFLKMNCDTLCSRFVLMNCVISDWIDHKILSKKNSINVLRFLKLTIFHNSSECFSTCYRRLNLKLIFLILSVFYFLLFFLFHPYLTISYSVNSFKCEGLIPLYYTWRNDCFIWVSVCSWNMKRIIFFMSIDKIISHTSSSEYLEYYWGG